MKKQFGIIVTVVALLMIGAAADPARGAEDEKDKGVYSNDWIEYSYAFLMGNYGYSDTTLNKWYYFAVHFNRTLDKYNFAKTPPVLRFGNDGSKKKAVMDLKNCLLITDKYEQRAPGNATSTTPVRGLSCVFDARSAQRCPLSVEVCVTKGGTLKEEYGEVSLSFKEGALRPVGKSDGATTTVLLEINEPTTLKYEIKGLAVDKLNNLESKDADNNKSEDGDKGRLGKVYEYNVSVNLSSSAKKSEFTALEKAMYLIRTKNAPVDKLTDELPLCTDEKKREKCAELKKVLSCANDYIGRNMQFAGKRLPRLKGANLRLSSSGLIAFDANPPGEEIRARIEYEINKKAFYYEKNETRLKTRMVDERSWYAAFRMTPDSKSLDYEYGFNYSMYFDADFIRKYGYMSKQPKLGFDVHYVKPMKRDAAKVPSDRWGVRVAGEWEVTFLPSARFTLSGEGVHYVEGKDENQEKGHHKVELKFSRPKDDGKDVKLYAKFIWGEDGLTFDKSNDFIAGIDVSSLMSQVLKIDEKKE